MGYSFNCHSPKVSIVIAVHNAERYVGDTLKTIATQTFLDFECLCVLNDCTDGSEEIARGFANNDERFRVLKSPKPSAGLARNTGLEVARGDYVCFLDSDDLFAPSYLSDMVAALDASGSDIAVCCADCFLDGDEAHLSPHIGLPARLQSGPVDIEHNRGVLLYGGGTMAWNKMFRRSFVLKRALRFQDLAHTNDAFFVLGAMLTCSSTCLVDERLVHYRVVEKSTQGMSAKMPLCSATAAAAVQSFADSLDSAPTEEARLWLNLRCCELFMSAVSRAAASGNQLVECVAAFRSFSAKIGDKPGFGCVNRKTETKYQCMRRCDETQLRWIYAKRGDQRVSSDKEKAEIAWRLVRAAYFGAGK